MNHKKLLIFLLALTATGFLIGFVLTESVKFGICDNEERFTCRGPLGSIGQPLGLGSAAIGLILIILLFCSKDIFSTWSKWAAWLIPAGAIWIMFTPVSCDAPLGACVDKEIATFVACGTFVVASLLVIIGSCLRSRRGKSLPYTNRH